MSKSQSLIHDSYQENILLDEQISNILTSRSSSYKKYKLLNQLRDSFHTPLALSHIEYYQTQLKATIRTLWIRVIMSFFILTYLLFILCRIYFYVYPEKSPYTLSFRIFPSESSLLVYIMIFVPLSIFMYYLTQYFSSQKTHGKHTIFDYIPVFFIIFTISVYFSLISWENTTQINNEIAETSSENYSETNRNLISNNTYISDSYNIHPQDFTGSWIDSNSQRCLLSISNTGISNNQYLYDINISWSENAWENTEWNFSGSFDENTGYITYTGYCMNIIYDDNGKVFKEFVYTNGSGKFYMKDNLLYWEDFIENRGRDCAFKKEVYPG